MKKQGKLYVFEGPDSVGKTSLADLLAQHLISTGIDCDLLAFPGKKIGTVGALIYALHHEPQRLGIEAISPTSLQMLHVAAHVDAIETEIFPALALGKTIILDRFWWSTIIYGQLGGLNKVLLNSIVAPEMHVWGKVIPTEVFLLERKSPLEFDITDQWSICANLYSQLADEQEANRHVYRISNDGSINKTLSTIIRAIKPR